MDTRLRVGSAIGKTEEEVAHELMAHLKERGHPDQPPAMATDGKGDYRRALVETWGQVPAYHGCWRPPTQQKAQPEWQYVQVIKERSGSQVTAVHIPVVYTARRARSGVCVGRLGLQPDPNGGDPLAPGA